MKNKNALLLTTCALAIIMPLKAEAESANTLNIVKPQHLQLSTQKGVYSKKSEISHEKNSAVQSCKSESEKADYRIATKGVQEQIKALKTYVSAQNRSPEIIDIIYNVSQETETDFTLLAVKALMESDLGRKTVANHSSARGIYQYIEPTWLTLMKRYGKRIGQEEKANQIKFNVNKGILEVESDNKNAKQEILDLRDDVKIATLIKAYQIKDETPALQNMKGARITATDHYIVHMLGLGMARTFYAMRNTNSPIQMASVRTQAFDEAVTLNKSFFYKGDVPLTATQAYDRFQERISAQYKKLHTIQTTYGQLPSIAMGARKCKPTETTTLAKTVAPTPLPPASKTQEKIEEKPTPKTISIAAATKTQPPAIQEKAAPIEPAKVPMEHTPKSEKSNMDLINAAIDKYRVKLRQ